jgi:hypothetical protein
MAGCFEHLFICKSRAMRAGLFANPRPRPVVSVLVGGTHAQKPRLGDLRVWELRKAVLNSF